MALLHFVIFSFLEGFGRVYMLKKIGIYAYEWVCIQFKLKAFLRQICFF